MDPSFLSITAVGLAATIAQVLVLRELLVLFHGNEMSAGFALAGWLIWTALGSAVAARRTSRASPNENTIATLLTILAAVLPGIVLVIRGARSLFGIATGELAAVGEMLAVSLTVPALVCPLAGALFGLCWSHQRAADAGPARRLAIYIGEALGAACGGVAFGTIGDLLDLAVYAGRPDAAEAANWHRAGQRIFIGMLIGFGFYIFSQLMTQMGQVYGLPPALPSLLPSLLFIAFGVRGIARV